MKKLVKVGTRFERISLWIAALIGCGTGLSSCYLQWQAELSEPVELFTVSMGPSLFYYPELSGILYLPITNTGRIPIYFHTPNLNYNYPHDTVLHQVFPVFSFSLDNKESTGGFVQPGEIAVYTLGPLDKEKMEHILHHIDEEAFVEISTSRGTKKRILGIRPLLEKLYDQLLHEEKLRREAINQADSEKGP